MSETVVDYATVATQVIFFFFFQDIQVGMPRFNGLQRENKFEDFDFFSKKSSKFHSSGIT